MGNGYGSMQGANRSGTQKQATDYHEYTRIGSGAIQWLPGVSALASGAGGAAGSLAWGGAPQRGAQPQEYEAHDLISPVGASDL